MDIEVTTYDSCCQICGRHAFITNYFNYDNEKHSLQLCKQCTKRILESIENVEEYKYKILKGE